MNLILGKFIGETDKFIEEYCKILSLSNYEQTAKSLVRMVGLINTKPHSLAGVCIYLACLFDGNRLDFNELRIASGIAKSRFRKLIDKICPHWKEFE